MPQRSIEGVPLSVRLTHETIARLEAIRPYCREAYGELMPISRSAVIRMALILGLEKLESEHAPE